MLRVFLLASVSVIASVWALARFYTHPRMPMVVPAGSGTSAGTDGEIPAPDLEMDRK